jgi:hypothetical protein
MGEAEIDPFKKILTIHSSIITYGNASTPELSKLIAQEIEELWNEPRATIALDGIIHQIIFRTEHGSYPQIEPLEIVSNTNARKNFFRIEEYASGNISFVDGLGSNTGYFKLENLYPGSTTAAHEFGHTLGLPHPERLDIRGEGRPGIMYPRGTWVDPPFQYDPGVLPGAPGGTMHPMHRRVKLPDIAALKLDRLRFVGRMAIVGEFTNVYHQDHSEINDSESDII